MSWLNVHPAPVCQAPRGWGRACPWGSGRERVSLIKIVPRKRNDEGGVGLCNHLIFPRLINHVRASLFFTTGRWVNGDGERKSWNTQRIVSPHREQEQIKGTPLLISGKKIMLLTWDAFIVRKRQGLDDFSRSFLCLTCIVILWISKGIAKWCLISYCLLLSVRDSVSAFQEVCFNN